MLKKEGTGILEDIRKTLMCSGREGGGGPCFVPPISSRIQKKTETGENLRPFRDVRGREVGPVH